MNFRGGGAYCNPAPVRVFSKFTRWGLLVSSLRNLFSQTRSRARYRFENKFPKDFFAKKRNNNVTNSSPLTVHSSLINETVFSRFTSHFSLPHTPAFTLAEVLITLGIIGIVAAITIPNLMGKYQKQVTVNKLKKINTVLSQIVLQSGNENGAASGFLPIGQKVDAETTENYFKNCWFPYLNAPTIFPSGTQPYPNIGGGYIKQRSGKVVGFDFLPAYSSGRAMFQTNDGVLFFVLVMGWQYENDADGNQISTKVFSEKQSVYVDLNGIKPPNTRGLDIFQFILDFEKLTVQPTGINLTDAQLRANCSYSGGGDYCLAKIVRDGWKIADDYPW